MGRVRFLWLAYHLNNLLVYDRLEGWSFFRKSMVRVLVMALVERNTEKSYLN